MSNTESVQLTPEEIGRRAPAFAANGQNKEDNPTLRDEQERALRALHGEGDFPAGSAFFKPPNRIIGQTFFRTPV